MAGAKDYRVWRVELHKLLVSNGTGEYSTLWAQYMASVESAGRSLEQLLDGFADWGEQCLRQDSPVLVLEGRDAAFGAAVCVALRNFCLCPYDRMEVAGVTFNTAAKDKGGNSIVMQRVLADIDVDIMKETYDCIAQRCVYKYSPIIDPVHNTEQADPYPTLMVGKVLCFYQMLSPGHEVLPSEEQVMLEFADVAWLQWPEELADRHCTSLEVPIMLRKHSTSEDFFKDDEIGRLAWCTSIVPTNLSLLPCKKWVDSKVVIDNTKWHVLHRHAGF